MILLYHVLSFIFSTESYCKNILKEMIRTTSKQIFIYDIKKNKIKKGNFILNARKRQKLTKKNTLINTNIHLKDFIQNLF